MNFRLLIIGFAVMFVSTTNAQMTGITFEVDTAFYGPNTPSPEDTFDPLGTLDGYVTYKVYAEFTNTTDVLSAIYSDVAVLGTIPMEIDAPCGMSLFVDQKGFANEAQAAVSMRLILTLMSDFKKEDAKATADSFTKLQKVVKCNDLVCALDHMLTLISYELNSEVDVENAAAFFHTTQGKANQELRTMFSTGVGRQWLLDARNFSLQRAMDAGFLGSPSQCILRL